MQQGLQKVFLEVKLIEIKQLRFATVYSTIWLCIKLEILIYFKCAAEAHCVFTQSAQGN